MHIDEEALQRFLHGEMDEATDGFVRRHLAECGGCRNRLEEGAREEAEVLSLLARLDHARPPIEASEVMGEPASALRARRPRAPMFALLLVAAAVAAWFVPGSPVPDVVGPWLRVARESVVATLDDLTRVRSDSTATPPADASELANAADAETAMSAGTRSVGTTLEVDPGGGLLIVFEALRPSVGVQVSLFEGSLVETVAMGSSAIFTSGDGYLGIAAPDAVTGFAVRVPHDAARVEIRVGQRRVFLKAGDAITSAVGSSANGTWLIPVHE